MAVIPGTQHWGTVDLNEHGGRKATRIHWRILSQAIPRVSNFGGTMSPIVIFRRITRFVRLKRRVFLLAFLLAGAAMLASGLLRSKPIPYTADNTSQTYTYNVIVRRHWWPPFFFFEQLLTPEFEMVVRNTGEGVDYGRIGCFIVEHDDVSSFPSVKAGFKDVQWFKLEKFHSGASRKFHMRIASKFLKPGRYMMKIGIAAMRPMLSPWDEMLLNLEKVRDKYSSERFEEIKGKTLRALSENMHQPKQVTRGAFVPEATYDYRVLEVITIHPVGDLLLFLTLVGGIFGILPSVVTMVTRRLKARRKPTNLIVVRQ